MVLVLFGTPYSKTDNVMKVHPRKTIRLYKRVEGTPSFGKGIPG
uniref:Uncharacterized protein n=1 Tax=Lepeophtheirus salmonis TaxID=72036 RepID=A0A0K2VIX4_LEPSM